MHFVKIYSEITREVQILLIMSYMFTFANLTSPIDTEQYIII